MPLKFFLAPLLGGIIGYITNDIAIKMLFHPRKSIYIGKFHIPFTPGLIPQQKNRIAQAIGQMVSTHLLNSETMRGTLLSPRAIENLRAKLTKEIEALSTNKLTIEEFLRKYLSEDEIQNYQDEIKANGEMMLMRKVIDARVGSLAASMVMQEVEQKLGKGVAGTLSSIGLEAKLDNLITQKIRENGPKFISDEIEKVEDSILSLRLCDLYDKHKENIPNIIDQITSVYKMLLEENLDKALKAIDIKRIVVEKIRTFNAKQLEEMVFGVMKRELKAIVYLGALLGFFMGFINILF